MSNLKGRCTILIYDSQIISTIALYKFLSPCFKIIIPANLNEAELIIRHRNVRLAILSIEQEDKEKSLILANAAEDKTKVISLVTHMRNVPDIPNSICLSKPVDFSDLLNAIQASLVCLNTPAACSCFEYFEKLKNNG